MTVLLTLYITLLTYLLYLHLYFVSLAADETDGDGTIQPEVSFQVL